MAASVKTQEYEYEAEHGYVVDGKVYLKGSKGLPDREIGIVKETPEQSIQYFINRFLHLKEKVEAIPKEVEEAENKGSYLQKIYHLREAMAEYNGLGDFQPLYGILEETENNLKNMVATNRVKNLEIKQALLKEAQENMDRKDYKEVSPLFRSIQEKWMKTGPVNEEYQEALETAFNNALTTFYEARKEYNESKRAEIDANVKKFEGIYEEFLILRNDKVIPVSRKIHMMNQLKNRWKQVGYAPRMTIGNWFREMNSFHNYLLRENRKNEQMSQNAYYGLMERYRPDQIKPMLVEEAKNLFKKPLIEAYALMQDLQKIWKESGPIKERNQFHLINQFSDYCERIEVLYELETKVRMENITFEQEEPRDQLNMKIDLIKNMLNQSHQDIDEEQDKLNQMMEQHTEGREIKRMKNKLSNMRRKNKIQNLLLKKLLSQVQEIAIKG